MHFISDKASHQLKRVSPVFCTWAEKQHMSYLLGVKISLLKWVQELMTSRLVVYLHS